MRIMADAPPAEHRSRGRPPIYWSSAHQRKLLRLYICFKNRRLQLQAILDRLKDETFDPSVRSAQYQLRELLASSNLQSDDWRPKNDAAMRNRVRFFRLARAKRRLGASRTRQVVQKLLLEKHRLDPHRSLLCPCLADNESMMSVDPRPHAFHGASQTDQTLPAREQSGALAVRIHTQSSLGCRQKAESLSENPSKRRSFLDSISSGIVSMTRSSSSASRSAKRSSTGPADVGLSDPLSKYSRAGFLSLFNSVPTTRGTLPIVLELRFTKMRKHPKPKSTVELNRTLITECCGLNILCRSPDSSESDGRLPNRLAKVCIHKRLLKAIKAQCLGKTSGLDEFVNTLTTAEANAVDGAGNLLIHTAARWGAGVPILIPILRHTDNVSSINQRDETFLHVYDPPPAPLFDNADFFKLVKHLKGCCFDFCQRDVQKRTMLHRLVKRNGFSVEMLHCVFSQLPQGSARFLVFKRSAKGKRLWDCVQKKLEKQSPQLKRIFGDEKEFVRRYLPEFFGFDPEEQTQLDASPTRKTFFASVYGRFMGPHETPLAPQKSAECHRDYEKSDEKSDAKRTKLMDFLCQAAIRGDDPSKERLLAKIPKDQQDQFLGHRDREGNTVLHYAAEFGMVTVVKFLCELKVSLNSLNNCGNTPLQLISYAIQRTDVKSDINMESRYMRCAVILLDAGADYRGRKHVQQPLGKLKKRHEQIFDGTEGQIERLALQGVARRCQGLHLLTPLKNLEGCDRPRRPASQRVCRSQAIRAP